MVRLTDIINTIAKAENEKLIIYHFYTSDLVAEFIISAMLNEHNKSVDLGQGRSIFFHKAHIPDTEDHLHFAVRGAKIAAINQSGSAHDRSHGIKLQRWALDAMEKHYPDFKRPPDGLIEALMGEPSSQLLIEAFDENKPIISRALRILAETKAAS